MVIVCVLKKKEFLEVGKEGGNVISEKKEIEIREMGKFEKLKKHGKWENGKSENVGMEIRKMAWRNVKSEKGEVENGKVAKKKIGN